MPRAASAAADFTGSGPVGPTTDESAATIDENNLDDMQALQTLTDASFMQLLHRRFEGGHVYTNSGPRVVVSVNPYNWEASMPLYSPELREAYRHGPQAEGAQRLPPHLYAVAETARRHRSPLTAMSSSGGRSQSLLVSGESGAGSRPHIRSS